MEGDKISYQWLLLLAALGLCHGARALELKGLVVATLWGMWDLNSLTRD